MRLPETCTVDLAEEEAEGVDDEGMMVRNQACRVILYCCDSSRRAQDPGARSTTQFRQSLDYRCRRRKLPYIVGFGAIVRRNGGESRPPIMDRLRAKHSSCMQGISGSEV